MSDDEEKVVVWLEGEVKTPPFTQANRLKVGYLLGLLQQGQTLSMPMSRPMSVIGPRCHELRINNQGDTWRIVYRIDQDAIVIAEVFKKKTQQTPKAVIEACQRRLADYDDCND